jgi:hypothetical protein
VSHVQGLYLFVSSYQSGCCCSTLSGSVTELPAWSSEAAGSLAAGSLAEAEEGSLWATLAGPPWASAGTSINDVIAAIISKRIVLAP